jgi:hypothetical protein
MSGLQMSEIEIGTEILMLYLLGDRCVFSLAVTAAKARGRRRTEEAKRTARAKRRRSSLSP